MTPLLTPDETPTADRGSVPRAAVFSDGSASAGFRLHLASKSPRRRELLAEHGVAHSFGEPGIDDAVLPPGRVPPARWVASLAYLKAEAAAHSLGHGAETGVIVLGADTTCVKQGRVIGTPKDEGDARRIVEFLADGEHRVLTGVALRMPDGTRDLWVSSAAVRVGGLDAGAIDAYIASGLWRGKAGAYNLRERIDAGWPITYTGDPTGIMGLPMRSLLPRLARLGVTIRPTHGTGGVVRDRQNGVTP